MQKVAQKRTQSTQRHPSRPKKNQSSDGYKQDDWRKWHWQSMELAKHNQRKTRIESRVPFPIPRKAMQDTKFKPGHLDINEVERNGSARSRWVSRATIAIELIINTITWILPVFTCDWTLFQPPACLVIPCSSFPNSNNKNCKRLWIVDFHHGITVELH